MKTLDNVSAWVKVNQNPKSKNQNCILLIMVAHIENHKESQGNYIPTYVHTRPHTHTQRVGDREWNKNPPSIG